MDEKELECKASSLFRFSRYRSPCFRQAEVKLLIQLVEKFKYDILNKASNNAANYAKERAWAKIAKEYNRQGLGLERSVDVLKTKWENMKRSARKLAKDVMEDECDLSKDEINKSVLLICNAENGTSDFDGPKDTNNFDDVTEDCKLWMCDEDIESESYTINGEHNYESPKKSEVPTGFSPRDCKVLLQCVRKEKSVLFSKSSVLKRQQAWKRIAGNFNMQSPIKRTSKELNRKFNNMKTMAKKVNVKGYFKGIKRKKYQPLNDDGEQKFKCERIIDNSGDFDFDSDDDMVLCGPVDVNHNAESSHISFTQDPLNNAHNSDSGLGSISDNKNAARLKIELLNYKMETARLERKRIEDAIKADEKERKIREIEQSLRLRTARLEAIAAESKLPSSHPSLKYTVEEARAQQYLCNAQMDLG